MKTRMVLENDMSWKLHLLPETQEEETMLSAIRRGMDVKANVYQSDDEPAHIVVSGEGRKTRPMAREAEG